jgi:hypothetical protein
MRTSSSAIVSKLVTGTPMAETHQKSIRKLVTLPPDLAERVETFRENIGAASESDALKALIENGLQSYDKPRDLYLRCLTMTSSGKSIADVINFVTSGHPLIKSTFVDKDDLIVNIKIDDQDFEERFRYSKNEKSWLWERNNSSNYNGNDWKDISPDKKHPEKKPTNTTDLDDEIPF